MNRRLFLGGLGALAAGLTLDPDRLLWLPGHKRIFDLGATPKSECWTVICWNGNFMLADSPYAVWVKPGEVVTLPPANGLSITHADGYGTTFHASLHPMWKWRDATVPPYPFTTPGLRPDGILHVDHAMVSYPMRYDATHAEPPPPPAGPRTPMGPPPRRVG